MSDIATLLFVYGTLRRNRRGRLHPLLRGRARYVGPASVRGRLYDLGRYPGLLLAGNDRVSGELYRLPDPCSAWPALDRYEECDPSDPQAEYVRRLIPVHRPGGTTVDAWCYLYNRPLLPRQRVHGGDYRQRTKGREPTQGEPHV